MSARPWYAEMTRYHWFVLVVAALGWLFDTMDQQLFNLARRPAMTELLAEGPDRPANDDVITEYAGYATAIFLMGWATGGIAFGILGDRIGRAKTMLLTILVYSLFTGLSALSRSFWDFAVYRFLTGLGVGGEFAVGVALVAEVMPDSSRARALGLLQALSAVGNISAALISIGLGHLEESGVIGAFEFAGVKFTAWRIMFVVGTLPALLAILIRRRLKEPEKWLALHAAHKAGTGSLGSFRELFGDPRWRKRAILGVLLASSGVIGLWGIGFFSIDLNQSVFRKQFESEFRQQGHGDLDREFILIAKHTPQIGKMPKMPNAADLLNTQPGANDAAALYRAILALHESGTEPTVTNAAVLDWLDAPPEKTKLKKQTAEDRERRDKYLDATSDNPRSIEEHAARIVNRSKELRGMVARWAGYTSMFLNLGAFLGIYSFSVVTQRVGRKPAFAVAFVAALISTAVVFLCFSERHQVFWMIPIMGFCQLSLFGGYAIYFPELFPTRLRSTGTSFCYNVGRFVAALGPAALGLFTKEVYKDWAEPMRPAGLTMCVIFLLGLLVLPFLPETKGQPLPE